MVREHGVLPRIGLLRPDRQHTRAYGRLIAGAGAFETPAPLRHRDGPSRLHVLAHEHGPCVLQARIVTPDGQPVAVLAVAEGGGDGQRRACRETVAAALG